METFIISGGEINIKSLEKYLSNNNFEQNIIAVDKGLEVLYQLKKRPNYVVGDFDSISKEVLEFYRKQPQVIFETFPSHKDNTDTDIALQLAIQLKSSNITILGALGKRMDHALSNIHILKYALEAKIPCQILDDYNKIYLVEKEKTLSKNETFGKYISLIPLSGTVEGLTLTGFQYPLTKDTLPVGTSLGISNEIISNIATIKLERGILIVIESRD